MAQTQRTITDIYNLLADNAIGDISAQDLRDAFETWRVRHGQIWVADPGAAITISDTTNYFEATNPTWTLSSGAHQFDESTGNGQLTYIGAADVVVHIAVSLSFTSASNSQVTHWRVAKNGSTASLAAGAGIESEVQRKTGTGADVGSTALHLIESLTNGDYLSLWARNSTSPADITLVTANLQVVTMPV